MWLHEGFGSYMQPLYRERLSGKDSYNEAMMQQRRGIRNQKAVAPDSILSSQEIYAGHDIYSKGSWILHTLRFLVGDEAFFEILRRQAYPSAALESVTDGSQTRFATTEDFRKTAESISRKELRWFFDVYLRQPDLPQVSVIRDATSVLVQWKSPNDLPFPMPIEVAIDGEIQVIEPTARGIVLSLPETAVFEIDPNNKVLRSGNIQSE